MLNPKEVFLDYWERVDKPLFQAVYQQFYNDRKLKINVMACFRQPINISSIKNEIFTFGMLTFTPFSKSIFTISIKPHIAAIPKQLFPLSSFVSNKEAGQSMNNSSN